MAIHDDDVRNALQNLQGAQLRSLSIERFTENDEFVVINLYFDNGRVLITSGSIDDFYDAPAAVADNVGTYLTGVNENDDVS